MENEKLTIPFVNKGKPFCINNWTVEKHAKALELLANTESTESLKETEFQYCIVYVALQEIDNSVSMSDVRTLHVDNLLELAKLFYYAGKIDIFFHQPDTKKQKK